MRYLKTLLVSLLALVGTSAFAQTWTGSEAAAGTYYLYNVGTGKWLCGGNNWGTHASVGDYGMDFILAGSNGAYTLDSQLSNGGNSHFLNGEWCDGASMSWTFTQVKTEDGAIAYTIGNGQQFLTANTSDTNVNLKGNEGALSQWILVSKADIAQAALDAKATDVVDVTGFIIGQRTSRNNTRAQVTGDRQLNSNNNVWKMERDADGRWCNFAMNGAGGTGSTAKPYAIEAWNWKSFNFYQDITEVPNGKYTLHVNSFYRGYDGIRGYVYANDAMSPLTAETDAYKSYGAGSDLQNAAAAFFDGKYDNSVDVTVTNGSIRVGVKQMDAPGGDWMPFANFRLEYKGMASLLKNAIDKANELMPTLNETNAAELQKAIDAAQAVYDNASSTNAEIEAALEALQDAYNTADAENIAKRKAIDVLNNVPYVLFPKDFKWALEDGEKYDKLTGEQKMDLDRDFKVYKNNNGKYQLASRIAVAALVKLLEYADADENTKKAIDARLKELGVEGYDEMLADAITKFTRLVVETHGVGAALAEQNDPNYSRMYAAIEEAGLDTEAFLAFLLEGASSNKTEWSDEGSVNGNVFTSDDGLLTITRENGEAIEADDYGYWYVGDGEDWTFTCNSDDYELSEITPISWDMYFTVNGGEQLNSWYYSWFAATASVSGKTATLHVDQVDPEDPTVLFNVTLTAKSDPWTLAGVDRTLSDIYEMLHQFAGGYYYGFDANFTAHIKDPNLTEGGDAWESTWGGILSNETLTDSEGNSEYPYFDANTWNESGTMEVDAHQTIQLPPGRYMLTAAGRASQSSLMKKEVSHVGTSIESYVWEGPFTEPGAQDPTNYFQLYATTFEGKTVAKSFFELEGSKGGIFDNGWNDASVFFTMPSVGDVTIGVRAATNVKERWASATRFRLTRLGDATVYLNEDETLTDEFNWDVVGNELGAYAPTDFLLKKKMEAGKWYSFAVPIDISTEQLVANFGEDVELAIPVETVVEEEQVVVNFLRYKPTEYYIEEDIFENPIRGTQANLPYLIKPAQVKESNRYLFKNITTTETKSIFKDGYWSYGSYSLSLDEDNWWYTLGDEDDVKVYPNYRFQADVPEAYTIEYSDTVKAYTSVIEAPGYDIAGVGLYIINDEGYVDADDSYLDILYQQLDEAEALGAQKAEWYPGIPAAITKNMTTFGRITNIWNAGAALKRMKNAMGEAKKAYEPSKQFNALMVQANDLLATEHTELVEGADAAFKSKLADLQKRFDALTEAAPIADLIDELKAAIAAYKEQIFIAGVIETGKYILQNVATGKFFNGANSWGTRSSLVDHPEYMLLTKLDDGTHRLESNQSNGGEQFYFGPNYFVDNGTPMPLTFTAVADGIYTITCNGESGVGLLGYDGSTSVLSGTLTDATSADAQWYVISEEKMAAMMAEASLENPVDVSFFIKDANFSRNHRNADAWIWETENHNIAGANENFCAESWTHTFVLSQEVELPNGVYMLNAQAALTDYTEAYDKRDDYPVVFAGDETVKFCEMEEADRATSMTQLSNSFLAGKYFVDPVIVKVTDGKLTIGAKCDATDYWCIFDNFSLTYFADADIDAVRAAYPKNTGATTGINEVNTGVNTGAIYNLNGVRVNNMTKKGVYIVNGKKFVVK